MDGRADSLRSGACDVPTRRSLLEELFESTFDDLYRYCLARTASPATAEEVAADTFLTAARSLAGQRVDIDRAWLFVVARNKLIDGWRTAERQRRRFTALVALRRGEGETSDRDDRLGEEVIDVLRRLPERQRAALALRYLDDCTVGEVATELDIEYTAAESLLARARRNFTALWAEHDGTEGQ